MYEDRTEENIVQEMLDSIPNQLDKRENQFIHNALSASAIKFAESYINLEFVHNKLDVENLEGEELERFIKQRTGIERHPATKATTIVTITGSEGSSISKGDLVASDTVNFIALEDVSIDSTGGMLVEVECELEGSIGNVPVSAIRHFPVTIPGLVSVTNLEPVTNGYDAEPDESLLERYYQRIRTPATSGNKYHYLSWAREVVGVGNAKVDSLWDGPGTVKVVIVDTNKQPASIELINTVIEHIEEQRPIGAEVTVVSASVKNIDVVANVNLAEGYTIQEVQASFEENLEEHRKQIAFEETYVSYATVGNILFLTEGVIDYEGYLLNGQASNIPLSNVEIPMFGINLGVI